LVIDWLYISSKGSVIVLLVVLAITLGILVKKYYKWAEKETEATKLSK